jgi:hypothetical protein
MLEKNKIMSQAKSSPLAKIPTKNRFDVLQSQESCLSQLQEPPQAIPAKKPTTQNTILECIKKKNEELRNKASKHTRSLVGTSHDRDKTKEVRRNIPPPHTIQKAGNTTCANYAIGQDKRPTPSDNDAEGTGTSWIAHQTPRRGARNCPLNCKGGQPPSRNQHYTPGPKRHSRTHRENAKNQKFPY